MEREWRRRTAAELERECVGFGGVDNAGTTGSSDDDAGDDGGAGEVGTAVAAVAEAEFSFAAVSGDGGAEVRGRGRAPEDGINIWLDMRGEDGSWRRRR